MAPKSGRCYVRAGEPTGALSGVAGRRRRPCAGCGNAADFTAYTWYETVDAADHRSKQGLMDLSQVSLPADVQVFTCGPLPFMRHVRSMLLARGVPASRIRYEVFGPDLWGVQG